MHGMENPAAGQVKDMFSEIERDGFTDDYLTNMLVETQWGRLFLIRKRADEILRENMFAYDHVNRRVNSDDVRLVVNSYNRTYDVNIYTSKRGVSFDNLIHFLRTFTAGIGALEDVFIHTGNNMAKTIKQNMEKTRVCDLYLLRTALENDNMPDINGADPDSLPELLYATHANWPPLSCKNDVHPKSAYTVVKEALAKRKAQKVDDIDMSNYSEKWSVEISHQAK